MIPFEIEEFIEEEDKKVLEQYFIITQPDELGKLPNRYITLIADEVEARDVFRKLGSKFNNIKQLNKTWSDNFIRKRKDQHIVQIVIYWDISQIATDDDKLQLHGFSRYLPENIDNCYLENFEYSRSAIKSNSITNRDLIAKMSLYPEINWVHEVCNEIIDYGS